MQSALITPEGSGLMVAPLDRVGQAAYADSVPQVYLRGRELGFSAGEILSLVGKGGSEFDPFCIFCRLWGGIMQFIGPVFTLAFSVLSALIALQWLLERAMEVGDFIDGIIKKYWPVLGLAAGVGGVGYTLYNRFMRDEDSLTESLGRMTNAAVKGAIIGFLPGPLSGAIAGMLLELFGGGFAGPSQSKPPIALMAPQPRTPGIIGSLASLGAYGSPLGILASAGAKLAQTIFGKDEAQFTNDEVQALAQAADLNYDELRDQI